MCIWTPIDGRFFGSWDRKGRQGRPWRLSHALWTLNRRLLHVHWISSQQDHRPAPPALPRLRTHLLRLHSLTFALTLHIAHEVPTLVLHEATARITPTPRYRLLPDALSQAEPVETLPTWSCSVSSLQRTSLRIQTSSDCPRCLNMKSDPHNRRLISLSPVYNRFWLASLNALRSHMTETTTHMP